MTLANPLTAVLLAVAVVFALVKGLNDGASIVAVTSAGISLMPLAAVLTLGAVLVVGPLLVGTRVSRRPMPPDSCLRTVPPGGSPS